jgi:hypothetical protein
MNLREIKKSVRALPPRKLKKLYAWLPTLISAAEAEKRVGATTRRATRKRRQTINRTYCLERVRCGKENCKCANGQLHGPYWYAYWTEGGRTKSQYVGKKLPKGVKGDTSQGVR